METYINADGIKSHVRNKIAKHFGAIADWYKPFGKRINIITVCGHDSYDNELIKEIEKAIEDERNKKQKVSS